MGLTAIGTGLGHATVASDASGPVRFMNPTTRYVAVPKVHAGSVAAGRSGKRGKKTAELPQCTSTATPASPKVRHQVYHIWRSRDNRKGRHAVVVSRAFYLHSLRQRIHDLEHEEKRAAAARHAAALRATSSLRETLRGIGKMAVRWPVWDISFDIALFFTLGSAIWVINAFFVWLPLQAPATSFANESGTGGGTTALAGGTVFVVGALLGMLEAVNENDGDCFGWALEEAMATVGTNGNPLLLLLLPRPDACRHHQAQRWRLLGSKAEDDTANGARRRQWSWCPSWHELRTHYLHDIGFWACAIQVVAATIFWIACFTGLPPAFDRLSLAAQNGIYWLPQVVGGTGFVVSSLLFMLETQPCWYRPAPGLLGWHIGFWNLVGSLGFTLCGAFGFAATQSADMNYAAALSSFIGSWAFLVGSVIQCHNATGNWARLSATGGYTLASSLRAASGSRLLPPAAKGVQRRRCLAAADRDCGTGSLLDRYCVPALQFAEPLDPETPIKAEKAKKHDSPIVAAAFGLQLTPYEAECPCKYGCQRTYDEKVVQADCTDSDQDDLDLDPDLKLTEAEAGRGDDDTRCSPGGGFGGGVAQPWDEEEAAVLCNLSGTILTTEIPAAVGCIA
ncbi:integral membrane protein [Grosmannia clavigera kw1407]|uniref:Integral membrane protein n=1 Tax=Grosmannia clavigera (strain kw1407 / UAMH 11150) TaxID=655863 RepID=F0XFV5_GROCL|nr:uncharacterized protein CMQ_1293 [Grosmannia clavigera kw1407]EFX04365.1 integral membrane protein [Grosmannia clavigera kw1407]